MLNHQEDPTIQTFPKTKFLKTLETRQRFIKAGLVV